MNAVRNVAHVAFLSLDIVLGGSHCESLISPVTKQDPLHNLRKVARRSHGAGAAACCYTRAHPVSSRSSGRESYPLSCRRWRQRSQREWWSGFRWRVKASPCSTPAFTEAVWLPVLSCTATGLRATQLHPAADVHSLSRPLPRSLLSPRATLRNERSRQDRASWLRSS